MREEKCPHVITTGKAGLILGMLSELHREGSPGLDGIPRPKDDIHLILWGMEIPLPCHCRVCYHVLGKSIALGRRHRIRTEDFTRYSSKSVITTATQSKLNQAIVSNLPTLYGNFERPKL